MIILAANVVLMRLLSDQFSLITSFFSVCITFLTKFRATLDGLDNSVQSDHGKIEKELRKACKTTQPKDERFVSFCNII